MPTTPTMTSSSSTPVDPMYSPNPSWSGITRQPGSTIQFASFDPATATGDHSNASAFRKLTLREELCRPKRVVIETTLDGRCTWRFVPNARREEGVEDEGTWPRVVNVCGELQTLTHDQWDVYKLDQNFNCLVRLPPHHASVTKSARPDNYPEVSMAEGSSLENHDVRFKRRLSDSVTARRLSGSNPEGKRKKARPTADDSSPSSSEDEGDDGADEEEVTEMIIDEDVPKRHQQSERLRKVRVNKEEARRRRRECNAQRRGKMGLGAVNDEEEDDNMSWTEIPNTSPIRAQNVGSPFAKRKVDSFSDEDDVFSEESVSSKPRFKTYERAGSSKRTRTVSPFVTKRAAEIKRDRRGNSRKEELERRAKARSQAIHENVMKELYKEAARFQPPPPPMEATNDTGSDPSASSPSQTSDQPSQEEPMSEEARRQAALEESRRKIAELEKDKHLWEAQARKRAAQESEEKARAEAARKARAAGQTAAAEQEKEKENARRRAAETEQRVRDAAAAGVRTKRMHARDAAQRDARTWISRGWSARRALERYTAQCEAFDALNFYKGDVIVFETVPWPVLMRPGSFAVEDIAWTVVETFFRQVRTYVPTMEFVKLVEKSHKRFHPDRWRSRRVLQCVEDEEEKECLEIAANTVAQALTPLWQEVTGR